jgi:hypothetical protein
VHLLLNVINSIKDQCPLNALEQEEMKSIPYASVVGSLMYAQVYTRSSIGLVVGLLVDTKAFQVCNIGELQRKPCNVYMEPRNTIDLQIH